MCLLRAAQVLDHRFTGKTLYMEDMGISFPKGHHLKACLKYHCMTLRERNILIAYTANLGPNSLN